MRMRTGLHSGCPDADASEMTSLPALQRLLERMESQAGRVVANELMARVKESGAIDEVGRKRLVAACREFNGLCAKASPIEEAQALLWRVQQLAANNSTPHVADEQTPREEDGQSAQKKPRQLRVPTTGQPYT